VSWDLQVGEIQQSYTTDEDIWIALNNFFFRSNVTMSYKFGLLKSFLENLYMVNEKLELNYDHLFYSFTKIYWNLVIHHSLWQSSSKTQKSSIQKIMEEFAKAYSIPHDLTFDKLPSNVQIEIVRNIKKAGKRYVIGAFYSDTSKFFYEFDLKQEYLRFNIPVYKFIQRHQRIITYMTNYHLALFLERNNQIPNINYLLNKVENVSNRESLNHFLTILYQYEEKVCFYCGKPLNATKTKSNLIHVDHFIPWSFVQSDNLWNLVLSCQTCNLKKNDKLAEEVYLNNILGRNEGLASKLKEDSQIHFEFYNKEKLIDLYKFSNLNGISEIWSPNT
jgi:5-methylcytosine-specific restriction endonuclease McrA